MAMTSPPRLLHFVLIAMLSVVFAGAAQAEVPSSEAGVEARRDRAKLEFQRGSELFGAGQYEKAVSAFMEADRLAPSAPLSFNIARAYERLSDTSGGLRWYRDYLRRSPNAKNAAEVKARITVLSAELAQSGMQQLTVLSMPVGAVVIVDGRALGVTPLTSDLALGKHRIQLDLPGYAAPGNDIVLTASGPQDLNLDLRTEPLATAGDPARSGPLFADRDSPRRFGSVPWLVAGTGAIGLGGALGFELARRSDEAAARHATTQLDFKTKSDATSRDQTIARVLGGVGAALLLTGTVMIVFNDRTPEAPRVGLGCTLHGCTASAHASF
jgi:tetratricopeptide (TPR) repeat protein